MNNFQRLLVRHGLEMTDLDTNSHAGNLLHHTLGELESLSVTTEMVTEDLLIDALQSLDLNKIGIGRGYVIDPRQSDLPLTDIDLYVRGIVRWLNELGIYTNLSCDGHGKRPASIYLTTPLNRQQMHVLETCTPASIRIRFEGKKILLHYKNVKDLLDIADNLYRVTQSPDSLIDIEAERFKERMLELFEISGSSGNERVIRHFLKKKLNRLVDYTYQDREGNLLGYRYYGEGPTILLSAHMDTFEEFVPGRLVIEKGTILTSSEGILGADDRAGIAVILEILDRLDRSNFNGTIKVALTTREEVGCIGSQNIDKAFIDDVAAAIVIDRRGFRDIVTSYAGLVPFCSDSYGELFEKAGKHAGMPDWKMTSGGLSDTRSFSEFGIPSVNLSTGYMKEHTDDEYVDYRATYDTVRLIESAMVPLSLPVS